MAMRKTLKALTLLFLLVAWMNCFAQNEKNTVKINPLSALFRTGSVFYEHAISSKSSVQLGFAISGAKLDKEKFRGIALTPEYRFYLKNNAPDGLYFAPFSKYQHYTISNDTDKGTYSSFGGGLMLGRQWMYKSGFVLDLFLGPAFNSGTYKQEYGNGDPEISGAIDGFGIRVGLAIGFGF